MVTPFKEISDKIIDIKSELLSCPSKEYIGNGENALLKYTKTLGKGLVAGTDFVEAVYKCEERDMEGTLKNKSDRNKPITVTRKTISMALTLEQFTILSSMKAYEECWVQYKNAIGFQVYAKFILLRVKHSMPSLQPSKATLKDEDTIYKTVQAAKEVCSSYMGFQSDIYILQYAVDYYNQLLSYLKQIPAQFSKVPTVAEYLAKEKAKVYFNMALGLFFIAKSTKNLSEIDIKLTACKNACSEAEQLDSKYIKPIALKAKVFVEECHTEKAKEYLVKLKNLDPNNEMFKNSKYTSILEYNEHPKEDPFIRHKKILEMEEQEDIKKEEEFALEKARREAIDEEVKNAWSKEWE
jgi:hypothetical protein